MADTEIIFSNFASSLQSALSNVASSENLLRWPLCRVLLAVRQRVEAPSKNYTSRTTAGLCALWGLPGLRLAHFFGGSTAFFHVIGRGPSALEKEEVIVTIMDHVRIANIGANTF